MLSGGEYVSYALVHLDTDGIKDLVVAEHVSSFGEDYGDDVYVYTYKDGDVTFAGKAGGGFAPIQYSSAKQRLFFGRGGGGAVEDIFYYLNGTNLEAEEYMWKTDSEAKCYHIFCYNTSLYSHDFKEEISTDECNRGSAALKEGMEELVFKRI